MGKMGGNSRTVNGLDAAADKAKDAQKGDSELNSGDDDDHDKKNGGQQ